MSSELHPSIVALVSLAANIAANHPKQGLCQLDRLKQYGVAKAQIDSVIEIARHIRDEAGETLDSTFDQLLATPANKLAETLAESPPQSNIPKGTLLSIPVSAGACCTPTASGQSCC